MKNNTWKLQNIVCDFNDPEKIKNMWRYEALKLFRQVSVHKEDVDNQVSSPKILKLTRERLAHMSKSLGEHMLLLENVLSCLDWRNVDDYCFANYLNENLDSSILMNEYTNFFRDWSWGKEENSQSIDLVKKVVKGTKSLGNSIVLGAGSGRFAYDLQQEFGASKMTMADINPFNLLIASKMINGEEVDLVEFPTVPKDSKSFAVKQTLKAPKKIEGEVDFLLTDARYLNFERESFDTIITPWLIDVIEMDLNDLLKVLNDKLKNGGKWINFGPIGFNDSNLSKYYSYEETLYLVEKHGFKINAVEYDLLPYMQSPHSNFHRVERVVCFEAIKESGTISPVELIKDDEWENIKNSPLNLPIKQLGLVEMHAFNKEVYELMSGNNTPVEIINIVANKFGIPKDQLTMMIKDMLQGITNIMRQNPNS